MFLNFKGHCVTECTQDETSLTEFKKKIICILYQSHDLSNTGKLGISLRVSFWSASGYSRLLLISYPLTDEWSWVQVWFKPVTIYVKKLAVSY